MTLNGKSPLITLFPISGSIESTGLIGETPVISIVAIQASIEPQQQLWQDRIGVSTVWTDK